MMRRTGLWKTAKKAARKVLALFVLAMVTVTASSCGTSPSGGERDPIRIVTTVFPAYDWMRSVIGEERLAEGDISLILLTDNGVDLHSYQPTVRDIVTIKQCDLLICVGGESEEWIEDVLAEGSDPDMRVIRMLDVIGDRAVMEEEEEEPDEHVWLSLKNAALITDELGKTMGELDPFRREEYRRNADALIADLQALDREYETVAETAENRTLVFGDRFPFRYLTEDYGLDYYAAFEGCSAESEASFETILFLADKLDRFGLDFILVESPNGERISRTVIEASKTGDRQILYIDDLQSASPDDTRSYLDRMRGNLGVLKIVLGGDQ